MAVKRLLQIRPQYDDGNGALASGYRLFFYAAGSSTKQNTYNSSTGGVANTNPIVLNASGEPSVEIWGTVGQTYKIGLAIAGTDDPPASFIWSEDNVAPINDTTVTLDQWVSGPAPTYVSATSFTLVGDQTSTFHKGRRLKTTNTGGTVYSTITATAFGALTTVTVANDSSTLDSGLSAVSYSLVAADNPSIDADMVHRKGASVVSAATTNIWGGVGDFIHVTGNTGPITSFGTAPYAGAERTVIFDSTPTITYNATTLVLPTGASIVAAAGDMAIVRADTTANMVVVNYIRATGRPIIRTLPTRQVLTSGIGATYTTPTGATRINVRMVGGGAGGAAANTNSGVVGTDTTFSTLTAAKGAIGNTAAGAGGAGGAGTNGDINISGSSGSGGCTSGAGASAQGGNGGSSFFGGAGGGAAGAAAGLAATTNSGSGGGGGGAGAGATSGGGGGAGAYVEKMITSPAATYTYTVGAGGNGGAAGGTAGGNGAAGIIIVDEFYD